MWKSILAFILREVLEFIVEKVKEGVALKKKAKEDKKKVSEALKETDAQKRAKNIRDLLSS